MVLSLAEQCTKLFCCFSTSRGQQQGRRGGELSFHGFRPFAPIPYPSLIGSYSFFSSARYKAVRQNASPSPHPFSFGSYPSSHSLLAYHPQTSCYRNAWIPSPCLWKAIWLGLCTDNSNLFIKHIIPQQEILDSLTVKNRDGRGVNLLTWIMANKGGISPSRAATYTNLKCELTREKQTQGIMVIQWNLD